MSPHPHNQVTRRNILKTGAGVAIVRALEGVESAQAASSLEPVVTYASLGVTTLINATGNVTVLGGSVMPPEVVAAWIEASKHFVNIIDLQNKVGKRIAQLVGVEGALVTTGAAGAMVLGAAAAVTRNDRAHIRRLPDTSGMRNEVILQKSHHSGYDNQLTNVGAKLIDVVTLDDIDRSVNPRTAMMFFMNVSDPVGEIRRADWIAAARRHDIPTLLDASADVPPVERMSEYCRMGFDLVAISGGKGLRGPNNTGLLLGRNDLIETAKLNTNPFAPTFGRMMKVGKEDMMAMLAAVERFVRLDHRAEWEEMERRIGVIERELLAIPTVECERIVPTLANHQPHLIIDWDKSRIRLSHQQVTDALMAHVPPIQIGRVGETGNKGILISVLALNAGEEQIIADTLRTILTSA